MNSSLKQITTKKQYAEYCQKHLEIGKLLGKGSKNQDLKNEYYLLGLIIKDYTDKQENPFAKLTPVDLLKALLEENNLTARALSEEIGVPRSVISEILNYKRGFSKSVVKKLSQRFQIGEESFLREYLLIGRNSNVA
ncbi:MAG: helix-turn-helix domain-containing protein [Crocinitomicaceae bacterium]|nr:helix-turn-helix domain-containing protein [Crocinitomicaceae bacterium]